eukprot:jgi/Tetstr1/436988/TSEL_025760.t1
MLRSQHVGVGVGMGATAAVGADAKSYDAPAETAEAPAGNTADAGLVGGCIAAWLGYHSALLASAGD